MSEDLLHLQDLRMFLYVYRMHHFMSQAWLYVNTKMCFAVTASINQAVIPKVVNVSEKGQYLP